MGQPVRKRPPATTKITSKFAAATPFSVTNSKSCSFWTINIANASHNSRSPSSTLIVANATNNRPSLGILPPSLTIHYYKYFVKRRGPRAGSFARPPRPPPHTRPPPPHAPPHHTYLVFIFRGRWPRRRGAACRTHAAGRGRDLTRSTGNDSSAVFE